jgi:hypothetical protein
MFTGRAKPNRIIGDPDTQLPDKWSSAVLAIYLMKQKGVATYQHTVLQETEKNI